MALLELIRNTSSKRWLRKCGIKLSCGVGAIPKGAVLVVEEGVSIHQCTLGFKDLHVGAMTYVRSRSELLNVSRVGRYCSVGNGAILGQPRGAQGHALGGVTTHPFQLESYRPLPEYAETPALVVGNDVWIGRDALVMDGLTVGTGAVVASRAVVTQDVPPYAVVAGVPARVIKYRHPPGIIARLLASQWWELAKEDLRRLPLGNAELFVQEASECGLGFYRAFKLTTTTWCELTAGFASDSGGL